MTQFNTPAYDIERPTGLCAFTGRKLQPGEPYVATLVETDEQSASAGTPCKPSNALGLKRLDVSLEAWQQGRRPEMLFGFWRSRVPEPSAKKRIFVDDEILLSLLRRLADAQEPQRLAFRFVLALILLRKKLLRYEGTVKRPELPGREWWRLSVKSSRANNDSETSPRGGPTGEAEVLQVLDPGLDEQGIEQVTRQLGEILDGEL